MHAASGNQAHPRAGGENCETLIVSQSPHGSSPRGRGKHRPDWKARFRRGLIPARAGKTRHPCRKRAGHGAHPRAGGENLIINTKGSDAEGSSPRGRGKLWARRRNRRRSGLIPARAGKTAARSASPGKRRAHPRAGGENRLAVRLASELGGSSPRGRGKQHGRQLTAMTGRLIPARAGKTSVPAAGVSSSRGSSPRGRGKRLGEVPEELLRRLIPARAGKTSSAALASMDAWAHPRAGGENGPAGPRSPWAPGSSPRGRGKHRHAIPERLHPRLIPARAGKTPHGERVHKRPWAHPRAGGENSGGDFR